MAAFGAALDEARLDAHLTLEAPFDTPAPGATLTLSGAVGGIDTDAVGTLPLQHLAVSSRLSAPSPERRAALRCGLVRDLRR